ncbi:hypothetical protein AB835_09475 [Candidatus Endobugula sertula]|uniref:Major facilitator superfamily (MFS) profile domain-containing protein n=1 Tax=Candidatus Endobugula sertula TaxID=62101 RepID=A0A1D2QP22_9GAMM|nr:hypothetical protein AB835_09475 [Candidatus Endobugula sertula]
MLGLFMVLPVLTLSEKEYSGSTVLLLGMALGVYGLTQALLQIPFGVLSDRFGRKPLIFIGLLLFVAGSLVAACADSVSGLIIGRALQGGGAIAGVIMAMVGDVTTVENRSKAMAAIGASIGLAFALSLILGPFISSISLFNITGIRMIFWVAVVLSLFSVVILFWAVPNPMAVDQASSALSMDHLSKVLKNQQCFLLYFSVFVLHYTLMALFVVVPLLLKQVDIDRANHSWVYLGVMLVSFIVIIPLMIIGEKKQRVKHLLQLAIGMLVISLLLLVVVPHTLVGVVILLGVFFIGFNYLEANLPSLLTRILEQQSRGAGSGVFATSQFLGAACGAMVSGWLYAWSGVTATLASVSLFLLVWLVLTNKMIIPQQRQAAVAETVN